MKELGSETIEGWRAIAARVSVRVGIQVNPDCALRWSRREDDPLPVMRWGKGRPRVYARVGELDAWIERQRPEATGGQLTALAPSRNR